MRTVRELTKLKREKISGGVRLYARGELFVIEREKIGLVVNNSDNVLPFSAPNGEISVEAHGYKIFEKEGKG